MSGAGGLSGFALPALGSGAIAWLGLAVLALRRRLELVARAEHELRGPLTALMLEVETLGCEPAHGSCPVRSSAALEVHLERVRLGLADLQCARSGRRAPARTSAIPLEAAVRRAVLGWSPAAKRLDRSLRVEWSAGEQLVRADRARVLQALGNLIANALEHGRGDVEVRGLGAPGAVRVEVVDAGPGPAARQTAPRRDGHGRGLAIASAAVRETGGSLSVGPVTRGAGVTIELPAKRP